MQTSLVRRDRTVIAGDDDMVTDGLLIADGCPDHAVRLGDQAQPGKSNLLTQ